MYAMANEPNPDPDADRPDDDDDVLDALQRRARSGAAAPGEDDDLDLVEAFRSAEAEPGEDPAADERRVEPAEADTASAEPPEAGTPEEPAEQPEEAEDGEPPDLTLIGYVARHDRPPAFTGSDEQPYTVDVDVDATGDSEAPYAAFLVFVRWAATGAGIMGHVESDDVAYGETEDEARMAGLELSLYDIKAELDAAIGRRERALED